MTETNAPTCAKHPKTVTYLTCASCGTPICPECFVETPVGHKCRACGRVKNPALTTPKPGQAVATFAVGVAAGALVSILAGSISLFALFLAFYAGRHLGKLLHRIGGYKVGPLMEVIIGGSILLGGVGMRLAILFGKMALFSANGRMAVLLAKQGDTPVWMRYVSMLDPVALVVLIIMAAVAVAELRK